MTNKPKYSAEDIVSLIISNTASQYSEEWKPDIVHTKEELIKIVESYANQEVKKACKHQRYLCADEFKKNIGRQSDTDAQTNIRAAPSPQD